MLHINNAYDKNYKQVTLNQIRKVIVSKHFEKQINEIQEQKNVKKKKALKDQLPAFIPSNFVDGRTLNHIVLKDYEGFIIADIDKLPNEQEVNALQQKMMKDKHVIMSFKSPSGLGLKVLFKVDSVPEKVKEKEIYIKQYHYGLFLHLSEYFQKNYNVTIDSACKDVTRLCYYSSDANLYHSTNVTPLSFNFDTNSLQDEEYELEENANGELDEIRSEEIAKILILKYEKELENVKHIIIKKVDDKEVKAPLTFADARNEFNIKLASKFNSFGIPQKHALKIIPEYLQSKYPKECEQLTKDYGNWKNYIKKGIKSIYKTYKDSFNTVVYNAPTGLRLNNSGQAEATFYRIVRKNEIKQIAIDFELFEKFCVSTFRYNGNNSDKALLKLENGIIKPFLETEEDVFDKTLTIYFRKYLSQDKEIEEGLEIAEYAKSCFKYWNNYKTTIQIKILNRNDLLRDNLNTCYFFVNNGVLKITKNKVELKDYSYYTNKGYLIFDSHIKKHINYNPELDYKKWDIFNNYFWKIANEKEENNEQIMTMLGMTLHRYKKEQNKMPIFTDGVDGIEQAGGTGKSLTANVLSNMRSVLQLHSSENARFQWEEYENQDIIFLNDNKSLKVSELRNFNDKTFTIEKKGISKKTFTGQDVPKVYITTNNILLDRKSTADRRRVAVYYMPNFFSDKNTVEDYIGYQIFVNKQERERWDFKIQESQEEYICAFAIACVQKYLDKGLVENNSEKDDIKKEINYLSDIGDNQKIKDFTINWFNTQPNQQPIYFQYSDLEADYNAKNRQTQFSFFKHMVNKTLDLIAVEMFGEGCQVKKHTVRMDGKIKCYMTIKKGSDLMIKDSQYKEYIDEELEETEEEQNQKNNLNNDGKPVNF